MENQVGLLFEWGRANLVHPWWIAVLVGFLVAGGLLLTWREYGRTKSLWAWILGGLRLAAVAALLLWFLQPRWRLLREEAQPSQLLVLVDTSASMLLPDEVPAVGKDSPSIAESRLGPPEDGTRWATVVRLFHARHMWEDLISQHELHVYTFDAALPLALSERTKYRPEEVGTPDPPYPQQGNKNPAPSEEALSHSIEALGEQLSANKGGTKREFAPQVASAAGALHTMAQGLAGFTPAGQETRLGEALLYVVQQHPQDTLAGIVLVSDGGHNAGADVSEAVRLLRDRKIPLFALGVGPRVAPGDVRVAEVQAPARVRPKDPFPVVVQLESDRFEGAVEVRLHAVRLSQPTVSPRTEDLPQEQSALADEDLAKEALAAGSRPGAHHGRHFSPAGATARVEVQQTASTTLGPSQLAATVRFELALLEEGLYALQVEIQPNRPEAIVENNRREVICEVMERPLRVLLVSGGPGREYQFLRSVLFRDQTVRVDILLQSAQPGAWQEADQLLSHLPEDLGGFGDYDCLVAIDPDWRRIARSPEDIPRVLEALERWIADLGAGMIFVAGNVYSGETLGGWRSDPRCQMVLSLLPVRLEGNRTFGSPGMDTGPEPWPIVFTPEGQAASYLWLEPGPEASRKAWEVFPGVYSCLQASDTKRGATVLAHLGDPRLAQLGRSPVYLAEHFYGAGRVIYLGSSELWRLRAVNEKYYERLWLQLIRHVAQGRLEGPSPRLLVAVDRPAYLLGETVFFRARILDQLFRPVQVESLTVRITEPNGQIRPVRLFPTPGQPGDYRGPYLPRGVGEYHVVLQSPNWPGQEASCRFRVELSSLEERTLLRNEPLLRELAAATGGRYLPAPWAAVDKSSPDYLPALVLPRTRIQTIVGPPTEPTIGQLLEQSLLSLTGGNGGHLPPLRAWIPVGIDLCLLSLAVILLAGEWLVRQLGTWTR